MDPNEPKPIPYTASEPVDLAKIAAEAPGPKRVITMDMLDKHGFIHCVECVRGGHTGDTLMAVFTNVVHDVRAMACKEHVVKYIRPKDIKRR